MGLIGSFAQGAAQPFAQMTNTVMEGAQRDQLMQKELTMREQMQARQEERTRGAQRALGAETTKRADELANGPAVERYRSQLDAQAVAPEATNYPVGKIGTEGNLNLISQAKKFAEDQGGTNDPLQKAMAYQRAAQESGDPTLMARADSELASLRSDTTANRNAATAEKKLDQHYEEQKIVAKRAMEKLDKSEASAETRARVAAATASLSGNIASIKEAGYEIIKLQATLDAMLDDKNPAIQKQVNDLQTHKQNLMVANERISDNLENYSNTGNWSEKLVDRPRKDEGKNPLKFDETFPVRAPVKTKATMPATEPNDTEQKTTKNEVNSIPPAPPDYSNPNKTQIQIDNEAIRLTEDRKKEAKAKELISDKNQIYAIGQIQELLKLKPSAHIEKTIKYYQDKYGITDDEMAQMRGAR